MNQTFPYKDNRSATDTTLLRLHHERLAIEFYNHVAIAIKPKLEGVKVPRWSEIGIHLRNNYRSAVASLLAEYDQ